ncbi:hypothetical protein [Pseudonocardia acaciae]|uniref:hypothetical protein n=1 Tax=Pseudonocardia acaciae TaxID=551276 RepID=UPI00048D4D28|nr:hypothetical protein [Pseudonocardia acaciae]
MSVALIGGCPGIAIPPPSTTASPDSEQPAQPHRLVAEHGRRFSVLERRALAAELMGVRRLPSGAATNLNQLAKAGDREREPELIPDELGTAHPLARHIADFLTDLSNAGRPANTVRLRWVSHPDAQPCAERVSFGGVEFLEES